MSGRFAERATRPVHGFSDVMRWKLGKHDPRRPDHDELDRAFSDLRTDLNYQLRPELSELASAFLSELTDARYTEMELDDQYNIVILEDGIPKPVLSGGEEDLANLVHWNLPEAHRHLPWPLSVRWRLEPQRRRWWWMLMVHGNGDPPIRWRRNRGPGYEFATSRRIYSRSRQISATRRWRPDSSRYSHLPAVMAAWSTVARDASAFPSAFVAIRCSAAVKHSPDALQRKRLFAGIKNTCRFNILAFGPS